MHADSIGGIAADLAQRLGTTLTLTNYVAPGLILYLPAALRCTDGQTRGPGIYVHLQAGAQAPGGTSVFSPYTA